MNQTDRPAFANIMQALASTFRTEASEPFLLGYWMGLEDLPIKTVQQAAVRAMREHKQFMPTVAELRALAGDLSPADRAAIAWDAVQKAHARHGYYDSVCFDDPAINAAIRNMGGWEAFDDKLETSGETWVRKDFERIYQVYCRRGVTATEGAALGGHLARFNHAAGFLDHVPPAAAIATTLRPTPMIGGKAQQPDLRLTVDAKLLEDIGRKPT